MGYCVEFKGSFNLNTPLTAEHAAMMRGYEVSEEWPGPVPDRFFNPWLITSDNAGFEVRTDKPGDWKAWLQYTIDTFLVPCGYGLSGSVEWDGEEDGDCGIITIEAGKVKARRKPCDVAWVDLPEKTRTRIGRRIATASREGYDSDVAAWQAALQHLGCTAQSDRTVFDD